MGRREDLGREFFRWELATAIAGSVMGVNPFDEPNVTEAKVATGALLTVHQEQGKLPAAEGVVALDDAQAIREHVLGAGAGDYVAFCAYFLRAPDRDRLFEELRVATRRKTRAATTLGYGPRFLHSTGQLHKGGANNGVFLQLTADVASWCGSSHPRRAVQLRGAARRAGAGGSAGVAAPRPPGHSRSPGV